jgi:magnesium chelatase family protein
MVPPTRPPEIRCLSFVSPAREVNRMLAQIDSGAVLGVDAYMVRVEVDLGRGMPVFHVVGLPESAVREGKERVTAALANVGFRVPAGRIIANLAPADVPKSGSAFDLPLALGLMVAAGEIPAEPLAGHCLIGELGLDGTIRPVRGVLSIAARCVEEGVHTLVCPPANAAEAAVVGGLTVVAAPDLAALLAHLRGASSIPACRVNGAAASSEPFADFDFADVRGQVTAKRALEIAAAGAHNVILVGPPGAGKSMLARRLPGILPPLTRNEAIAATKVHSVAGTLRAGAALLTLPPFRAPHHSVSEAGLVGGGSPPRPGEVSLAHHGVLFLDEIPQMQRHVLESLRQPVEDGVVNLGRARIALSYPARFMLVAAMNPCPCGYHGTGRCICRTHEVERYASRISGPLFDRMDLHINMDRVPPEQLGGRSMEERSEVVRQRVIAARDRQQHRAGKPNAALTDRELADHCALHSTAERRLRELVRTQALSARAWHRIARVARTVADLEGCARVAVHHVNEVAGHRALDRPLPARR